MRWNPYAIGFPEGEEKQNKSGGKSWENYGQTTFKFHEEHQSADLSRTTSPSKISEKTATLVPISVKHENQA